MMIISILLLGPALDNEGKTCSCAQRNLGLFVILTHCHWHARSVNLKPTFSDIILDDTERKEAKGREGRKEGRSLC